MKTSLSTAILFGFIACCASVHAESPDTFLKSHCIRCHGPEVQSADRRFDDLPQAISQPDQIERWQEIVDQLNLQAMPPEGEPQPGDAERAAAVRRFTRSIAAAGARLASAAGHTVLRRLNAWEYRQTIGDLLGLNVEAWNPAADFPQEVRVEGFDNNGRELVTSSMLLDRYLGAAEEAVLRSTHFEQRPKPQKYAQSTPFYFSKREAPYEELPKLFHLDRFRFEPETPYTDLYGRHYRGGHLGFLPLAMSGVPHSGVYTIRVRAAAVDRVHDYGKPLADFHNGDPLVLGVLAVDRRGSVESTGSVSHSRVLATVELTDEKPKWLEWRVYLEKGYEPEVRFMNGTLAAKRMIRLLLDVADEHEELRPYKDMPKGSAQAHGVLKAYRGPKLRVWEIQVEGPDFERWPPRGHRLMYGNLRPEDLNARTVVTRLRAFAEAAFRRPPSEEELAPIESLVLEKLESGMAPLAALQLGLQTVLCAPGFLYLREGEGPLDDYALASRLSYFLWSSMPDEELLELAARNELNDPRVLREQVRRMLSDARSQRFVRHFIRRWLDLDNIGEMPPSTDFTAYYRDNLESAMRAETETFFRHVLDNNLSPRELLTADYTFLNRALARHYGVENVEGSRFRRVSLAGTPRGGLLTHGTFLTASANGVDTSPVVRGVYVLEKLLGYTPPPPPDDVPAIEPDVRGAKTIRDRLAKHRQIETCAACHRKIDPLGFALENFDAIGGWRSEYEGHLPIDASGSFPEGETFTSVPEFRRQLSGRADQFTRCLAEKLLTYAIGRALEAGDRPHVDAVVNAMQAESRGLRDLIELVVLSDTFRRN